MTTSQPTSKLPVWLHRFRVPQGLLLFIAANLVVGAIVDIVHLTFWSLIGTAILVALVCAGLGYLRNHWSRFQVLSFPVGVNFRNEPVKALRNAEYWWILTAIATIFSVKQTFLLIIAFFSWIF